MWKINDPLTNQPTTIMRVYPAGRQPHQPACLLIVGNWLDGTTDAFIKEHNVKIIVKASGNDGPLKPPVYGKDGAAPLVFHFPINAKRLILKEWVRICMASLEAWKEGTVENPVSVLAHCNEGKNRAPAAAAVLVSKMHNSDPWDEASVLAASRIRNPLFTHGTLEKCQGRACLRKCCGCPELSRQGCTEHGTCSDPCQETMALGCKS